MPGSSLQCWVWLMCKDAGVCDRALQGGGEGKHRQEIWVSIHSTTCILLMVMTTVGQLLIPVTLFYEL